MLKVRLKSNFKTNRCAILFRGHHHRIDRFGFLTDAREYFKSHHASIISPLRSKYEEVDIYLVTFPSPILGDVVNFYQPKITFVDHKQELKDQKQTMLCGLNLFNQTYDRYFIFRFDYEFKKSILDWAIWQHQGIYFPWREYKSLWEAYKRVGDTLHVVDYLEEFKKGITSIDSHQHPHFAKPNPSGTFHNLYNHIDATLSRFICDGYYDSNTMYNTEVCRNPLYHFKHRPYFFKDVPNDKSNNI